MQGVTKTKKKQINNLKFSFLSGTVFQRYKILHVGVGSICYSESLFFRLLVYLGGKRIPLVLLLMKRISDFLFFFFAVDKLQCSFFSSSDQVVYFFFLETLTSFNFFLTIWSGIQIVISVRYVCFHYCLWFFCSVPKIN